MSSPPDRDPDRRDPDRPDRPDRHGSPRDEEPGSNLRPQPSRQISDQFNVSRRVYLQDTLNEDAGYHFNPRTLKHRYKKTVKRFKCMDFFRSTLPILKWLPRYNMNEYLLNDIVAGTTTAVMHVPQGMAASFLAEAPAVMGLYMSFFPVIIYIIFGNSPHIAMGTFSVACLMAGKVVLEHATDSDETDALYTPLEVLSLLSFMVGLFQLIMWGMRLGSVSALLSEPVVSGFTTAAGCHVVASQLKDIFGMKLPRLPSNFKVITTVLAVSKNIGDANWVAFTISLITCIILTLNNEYLKPWVSKKSRFPIPIELIVIIATALISSALELHNDYDVKLIGTIPVGLPSPTVPPFGLFGDILLDAFVQTMVTYTITMSMSLIFAAKEKYEIDANQELLAMGSSNIFACFFSCAPICASLSRSYMQYNSGCKTMITSLMSAVWILVVLLWMGPWFEPLPRCVLASIMIVALKGLFLQVKDLKRFWELSKLDALVWLVTFSVTLVVNVDIGLAAGLLASVGALFYRSQTPYTCLLGRVMDTDIYMDIKRYRAAKEIPGIKIFHYCGGLNFATKNLFRTELLRKTGYLYFTEKYPETNYPLTKSASSYKWDPNIGKRVKCVVIDASALSYVDAPGIKALIATKQDLMFSKVKSLLAGANAPVLEMIARYNDLEAEPLHVLTFPTVHDAVMYYIKTKGKKKAASALRLQGTDHGQPS